MEEIHDTSPAGYPSASRSVSAVSRKKAVTRPELEQVISGHQVPGISDSRQRLAAWQIVLILTVLVSIFWSMLPGQNLARSLLALFFAGCWFFQYLIIVSYRTLMLLRSLVVLRAGKGYIASGPALADHELPRYTVLVPLYREAVIVPQLVSALRAIDYPAQLLEVFYLVRPDDRETREALAQCGIQTGTCELVHGQTRCLCSMEDSAVKVLLLPHDLPVRTKPAACNWGLAHATGEMLVIFDAEDIPDRDQLRKAAAALRHAPRNVACVESSKRPYNGSSSLLARLYEIEALNWQLLLLPGLASWEKLASLYGSGAHFRTEVLRELGGWDYYNVTEDCDLGIRLHRKGYLIGLLNSVTREEAPSSFSAWVRQRSRWNKGFLQTHLKHTRRPGELISSLGVLRAIAFLIMTGTAVLSQLIGLSTRIAPLVFAAVITVRVDARNQVKHSLVLVPFVISSALLVISIVSQAAGPALARRWRLIPFALLMPLYWFLIGLCAWRGVWQLIISPFQWEKTSHRGV